MLLSIEYQLVALKLTALDWHRFSEAKLFFYQKIVLLPFFHKGDFYTLTTGPVFSTHLNFPPT
jgi:hypothetical protein